LWTKWGKKAKSSASSVTATLLDCFFPPHCYSCQEPARNPGCRIFCESCFTLLSRTRINQPLCSICGRPLSEGAGGDSPVACLNCRIKAPHFTRARALFPYQGPAGAIVRAFKYSDQFNLGSELVELATRSGWFPAVGHESWAVAAVPLHRRQKKRRGYNQAALLAKQVAKHVDKPFEAGLLKRMRDTPSQTQLSPKQRIKNVKGAFSVRHKKLPGRVLLVDDVYTTGATVNECAKVLKRAGCKTVEVFTLVRAAV